MVQALQSGYLFTWYHGLQGSVTSLILYQLFFIFFKIKMVRLNNLSCIHCLAIFSNENALYPRCNGSLSASDCMSVFMFTKEYRQKIAPICIPYRFYGQSWTDCLHQNCSLHLENFKIGSYGAHLSCQHILAPPDSVTIGECVPPQPHHHPQLPTIVPAQPLYARNVPTKVQPSSQALPPLAHLCSAPVSSEIQL